MLSVETTLNNRERFMGVMNFKKVDKIPLIPNMGGGSYNIPGEATITANRWYSEGLPAWSSVIDYFGFNFTFESVPVNLGMIPPFPEKTLFEDDQYLIVRDADGVKKKIFKRRSSLGIFQWGMPQFLDFPVKNRKDWEEIKKRFDPSDPRRLGIGWGDDLIEHCATTTNPVYVDVSGFFSWCRELMGLENFLITMYKDPGLIHDMMEFRAQFTIEVLELVVENCQIDFAMLGEDMAYRNGPLASPKHIKDFMVPRYKEETSLLKKNGVDLVFVDSDGDVNLIIPLWLEAGINGTFPLEVMAGNDAVQLSRKYPKELRMVGNIDKMALIQGEEAIDKELEYKLQYLLKEGGYLPAVDHGIPPEVPLKHYNHYIQCLKKYLEKYSAE